MSNTSLSRQCAHELYSRIAAEGQFAPGEKLPNELELAQQLGVSRTTLREALRSLRDQGILEVRRGKGTFVSPQASKLDEYGFEALNRVRSQLRDLFELRAIVEPQAARLACRRASARELEEILTLGAAVEGCILRGEDRSQADRAFHAAIVRATHNEFMMRLLPIIDQAVSVAIGTGEKPEQLSRATLSDHGLLLEFFRLRDENGAEHAMAIHLLHSMDVLELDAPT